MNLRGIIGNSIHLNSYLLFTVLFSILTIVMSPMLLLVRFYLKIRIASSCPNPYARRCSI